MRSRRTWDAGTRDAFRGMASVILFTALGLAYGYYVWVIGRVAFGSDEPDAAAPRARVIHLVHPAVHRTRRPRPAPAASAPRSAAAS